MSFEELLESYKRDPERLLTRRQAAEMLGLQPQTLAVWACERRSGLPFRKVGSRAMYRLGDVVSFIDGC